MFQLSSRYLIPVAALIFALTSCGKSNPNLQGGNSNPVRVKVTTAAAAASTPGAAASDSYSGTVEAGSSSTPSFSAAGTITAINVAEGQRINKGQLIATINGSSLKNAYEIAAAELREAQDAYARMKKLHDAKALPDMQWVAMQEKLKQAEAAAEIARTGMNDASLYAPIAGIVSKKFVDVGQAAAPGIPVVEIMDLSSLKVKISVPEADLKRFATGSLATVTAGGRTYAATLVEKGVAANSLSRNYDIKFRVADPDGSLLPGMICSVEVDGVQPSAADTPSSEIVLPPQAIVLDWNNESYVWTVKNGLAQRQKVSVGGLDSRGVIVNGGLGANDSVVVEGQQKLCVGLKVVPVK